MLEGTAVDHRWPPTVCDQSWRGHGIIGQFRSRMLVEKLTYQRCPVRQRRQSSGTHECQNQKKSREIRLHVSLLPRHALSISSLWSGLLI
jgi:hypothetical protein